MFEELCPFNNTYTQKLVNKIISGSIWTRASIFADLLGMFSSSLIVKRKTLESETLHNN